MHDRELFIDGRWRAARRGPSRDDRRPCDGRACWIDRDRGREGCRRRCRRRQTRSAALGGDACRRARARFSTEPPTSSLNVSTPIADVLTREQGKPIPDAIKEIRFGVEVIRYYAEEGRRIGGSIRGFRAVRRAQSRRHIARRRGRRDHALELSSRHLCVEGRAGAGRRLHSGRQAAAGDAARHRARRAMFRRRRSSATGC